jgi:HAD superfamily hydrolase (TIGR01549 family)
MNPKAVFFDLGDTLIFSAHAIDPGVVFPLMANQVQPLLEEWNIIEPPNLPALLNQTYHAVETAQPARRARGFEVDGAFILRGAFESVGVSISDEQARLLWRASAIDYPTWGAQVYPDTIDTLSRLRGLSIATACVSNNWNDSTAMRHQLDTLGMTDELLPVLVSSTDMMRVKPEREPFDRALELVGVDVADVVFVGDEIDADIRGGKALGFTTVWKLNGRQDVSEAPEADYMIHELWEVFTLGLIREGAQPIAPTESPTPHEDANADRY